MKIFYQISDSSIHRDKNLFSIKNIMLTIICKTIIMTKNQGGQNEKTH